MSGTVINVAIVHSDRLFREALGIALANQETICFHGEQSHLEGLDFNGESSQTHVVLVEATAPLAACLEQVSCLRTTMPACKTIMLGVPDSDEAVLACIEHGGASGYVLENGSFDEVVRSIRSVAVGETVCSPRVASLVFSRMSVLAREASTSTIQHPDHLTRREREIVVAIEKGWTNKEIAVRLGIEVSTVKNHVHNILDKLQLHDRHSAARYAKHQRLTAMRS
jgi:two-component system nitrate/nitrite response regulator NarL